MKNRKGWTCLNYKFNLFVNYNNMLGYDKEW